ncbi:MAG: hypothetical protein Q9195_002206 [Heterodermia aff. obscurata]
MPYTPPSSHAPVASKTHTAVNSWSQYHAEPPRSDIKVDLPPAIHLPHSSSSRSYLHKHRRSPPISKSPPFQPRPATPDATPQDASSPESEDGRAESPRLHDFRPSSPAVTKGAAISPPDSSQNSSDDETNTKPTRVRDPDNLAELQAAIRIIEQHRASSPDLESNEEAKQARTTLGLASPRLDPSSKVRSFSPRPPLSAEARKISHSRSSTDASAFVDFPRNKFDSPTQGVSNSNFEEVDEAEIREKPALVRKKSGEPVRPALRPHAARRRPSSMPGTPTYSKAVHFKSDLEQVRTFLQVDRPLAVSAGSSPVEAYDNEIEFPFGDSNGQNYNPPFEWEIRLTNFPRDTLERSSVPVKVERVYLSPDNKQLLGAIAVQNISFHKLVIARFTLDYWKTTSEVKADYNHDVRRKQISDGYDRFVFSIKLEDQANLENKTMFFCVRYNVNGQDFWDNNHALNYQVDFSKKPKSLNGKLGSHGAAARPLNSLPRSKPSAPVSRPRSFPPGTSDDFASSVGAPYDFSSFPQPSAQLVGESPIRFKKSTAQLIPDAPERRTAVAGQAFGNRYDFGASLSAAIQAASSTIGERNGIQMKQEVKSAPAKLPTFAHNLASEPPSADPTEAFCKEPPQIDGANTLQRSEPPKAFTVGDPAKPAALTAEKPSVQSSSYNELLDKYCFFGSGKGTPNAKADQGQSQFDVSPDNTARDQTDKGAPAITPSRSVSPPIEAKKSFSSKSSTHNSHSVSPASGSQLGSRATSPVAFDYPFQSPMAIHG